MQALDRSRLGNRTVKAVEASLKDYTPISISVSPRLQSLIRSMAMLEE